MAETFAGLRIVASAVPQPQTLRSRLLRAALRGSPLRGGRLRARAAVAGPPEVDDDDAMSIDSLHRFFDLNIGRWNGSFYVRHSPPRDSSDLQAWLPVSRFVIALNVACACAFVWLSNSTRMGGCCRTLARGCP